MAIVILNPVSPDYLGPNGFYKKIPYKKKYVTNC